MTEEYYAQLDNLMMDELNVKKISRPIAKTEQGEFSLYLEKGSLKYYFTLAGERVSETSNEKFRNTLLMNLLNDSYNRK